MISTMGVVSFVGCIWFGIDCKRLKRFMTDKIEWSLYVLFSVMMTFALNSYYI